MSDITVQIHQHITIAKASGGTVYMPYDNDSLRDLIVQIANELNCKIEYGDQKLIISEKLNSY